MWIQDGLLKIALNTEVSALVFTENCHHKVKDGQKHECMKNRFLFKVLQMSVKFLFKFYILSKIQMFNFYQCSLRRTKN